MPEKVPYYRGVLILGASSDIASHLAGLFAVHTQKLYLSSRTPSHLDVRKEQLEVASQACQIHTLSLDAQDYASHQTLLKDILPLVDLVICAFGYLGDEQIARKDFDHLRKVVETNYLGMVSVLNLAADAFVTRGEGGNLVAISSVAGLRGRQVHCSYASAKAALNAYLSGLRQRLWPVGVHVMTVLPGLVRTKMTSGRKQHPLLSIGPELAAYQIYQACLKKKDIVYVGSMWRLIMFVLCHIPEVLFKRLRF